MGRRATVVHEMFGPYVALAVESAAECRASRDSAGTVASGADRVITGAADEAGGCGIACFVTAATEESVRHAAHSSAGAAADAGRKRKKSGKCGGMGSTIGVAAAVGGGGRRRCLARRRF